MLAGPVFIAAVIVVIGGALKIGTPAATQSALRALSLPDNRFLVQLMGVGEVAVATAMLAFGGPIAAALLVVAYLLFAGFVIAAKRSSAGLASCGCFGSVDTPPSVVHVVVNLASAAVLGAAIFWPVDDLGSVVGEQPWLGVPFLGIVALGTWLVYVMITLLPQTAAPERSAAVAEFTLRGTPS